MVLSIAAALYGCAADEKPRTTNDGTDEDEGDGSKPDATVRRDGGARDATTLPPSDGAVKPGKDGSQVTRDAPLVTVEDGVLRGKQEGNTNIYLGVPYAAAPVGALRFASPQKPEKWQGERDATKFGLVCTQAGHGATLPHQTPLPQGEDCLNVNVYAPKDAGKNTAVMAFIHGGSGITGSGSDYDARALSEAANLIVVTMNYRLGPLGWITHSTLDTAGAKSGNYGLRDQQLALQWIHDNIQAFHGDPGNVTLFGQSAGSSSTCLHMFMKGSEDLAQRFIMESGGCVGSAVGPQLRPGVDSVSNALVADLCPDATDVAACLRELDAKELMEWKQTGGGSLKGQMGAYVDGELLPGHPRELIRAGKFNHGELIVGSNLRESDFLQNPFFGQPWPLVKNGVELAIGLSVMYPDEWTDMIFHYGVPVDDADANRVIATAITDSWFRCPARALAREASKQGSKVYLYSFDVAPAVHMLELDYVFGWPDDGVSELWPNLAPVPALSNVVKAVQSYWGSFAKTGNPNGGGMMPWPAYDEAKDENVVLAEPLKVSSKLTSADCDFWDSRMMNAPAATTNGGLPGPPVTPTIP